MTEEKKPDETELQKKIESGEWIIRPCSFYKGEFKECRSIRGRFQQYFVYGELLDCEPWRTDYHNCKSWYWWKSKQACCDLIDREYQRRDERLTAHKNNDIWTKRDKPPEDWNKPLPQWMIERAKNSYLSRKAEELRAEEAESNADGNNNIKNLMTKEEKPCSIM